MGKCIGKRIRHTLDIYVDGKLTKTCLLPGIAIADGTGICVVAPADGSFNIPKNVGQGSAYKNNGDNGQCNTTDATAKARAARVAAARQLIVLIIKQDKIFLLRTVHFQVILIMFAIGIQQQIHNKHTTYIKMVQVEPDLVQTSLMIIIWRLAFTIRAVTSFHLEYNYNLNF